MIRSGTVRAWLRPGLIGLHVFATAAVAFCVVMGLWQMGVYDSRQLHEQADKQKVATVSFQSLDWGTDDAFTGRLNHRPVTITGEFAATDKQVWVSNKTKESPGGEKDGYWLLAPFFIHDHDHALLVVRGWLPSAGTLPTVPEGETKISAILEGGEAAHAPLNADRVIGSVRIPALVNEMPFDLYAGYAISTSSKTTDGFALADPPLPDASWMTGLRNLMYALQWWVFGGFAIFMWWRMATESVAATRAKVS